MAMIRFLLSICTLGPVGYLTGGGTCASFLTFIFLCWTQLFQYPYFWLLVIAVSIVACLFINQVLPQFKQPDPSIIVIDEVAGACWALLFLPYGFKAIISCFVLYRLFDITKWCGIQYAEKLPGAIGVVADDIAAGILANIVVQLLYWIFT